MAKEFQLDITDMFQKGLRPEGNPRGWNSRDAKDKLKYLEVAKEVVVEKEQLTPYHPFIFPFTTAAMTSNSLYYTYPYGQTLDAGVTHPTAHTLYWFGKTTVKIVTIADDGTLSNSSVSLYKPDGSGTTTCNGDGPWKFVYFNRNFWLAFNGSEVIMRHQLGQVNPNFADTLGKVIIYNGVGSSGTSPIKCGAEHRGRLLLGGFTKGVQDESREVYNRWLADTRGQSPIQGEIAEYQDWQQCTVWWSSIGGGDALELFYPDIVTKSTADTVHFDDYGTTTDAYKFRRTKQNQSGWMVLPYSEPIIALTPIGKNIIVQTRKHTGMLTLQSKPIATYGFEHIANIGLQSPTSVTLGKNGQEVFFVASTGVLCCVDQKGKLEYKGYKKQIIPDIQNAVLSGDSAPSPVHSFYDTANDMYVVSTENKSLLLTENGMSECNQTFSGRASLHPNNSIAFDGAPDNDVIDNCWITGDTWATPRIGLDLQTDAFSFAPKGLCRLNWVNVNFGMVGTIDLDPNNLTPVMGRAFIYVTVYYKTQAMIYGANTDGATTSYDSGTAWRKKVHRVTSAQADAFYFGVEGYYFKIRIHTSSNEITPTIAPDSVNLRWQLSDKRFTRGAY